MITFIRTPADIYKKAYEDMKFKYEIAEAFNERYEKQIKQLKEQNEAYKVLLKKQLEEK